MRRTSDLKYELLVFWSEIDQFSQHGDDAWNLFPVAGELISGAGFKIKGDNFVDQSHHVCQLHSVTMVPEHAA